MQRRATATSGFVCFCAATLGCAIASPVLASEAPHLLKQPEAAAGNPFDAALRDNAPPRQYGSYRYLGRGSEHTGQAAVVFADESRTAGTESRAFGEPGRLFENGGIAQAQYPLDEPPAALAPDEPGWVTPTQPTEHKRWITANELTTDVTSVLGSGDLLGITSVVVRGIIESPRLPGFSIRPIAGLHALAGPTSTDLPGQLYDVSVEARMYWPFGDRLLGEFALAPGIYSDFQNTSDAIRIVGRGVAYYKCRDTLRLAMGATYLDRKDIAMLPIAGLIWTPNDDWRYEIMFPSPRITHRYFSDGEHERWVYLRGEFGGGSWAIERANGTPDTATYRSYRFLIGWELNTVDGSTCRLEAGYEFGRHLEYESTIGNYDPDGTAVVGAAFSF